MIYEIPVPLITLAMVQHQTRSYIPTWPVQDYTTWWQMHIPTGEIKNKNIYLNRHYCDMLSTMCDYSQETHTAMTALVLVQICRCRMPFV